MEENKNQINIGFMALTDCAPVIVAKELGFDRQNDLVLNPVKLSSWSALRDHLAFEKLECAHMLGGLALAMHVGLSGLQTEIRVPLLLGRGGNAITISNALYDEALEAKDQAEELPSRSESAKLLKPVIQDRRRRGLPPLKLAVVHVFSSHHYELRSWLAHGDIDPDHDLEIIVIPPHRMIEALKNGHVDGYCVGEPWGQLAAEAGLGRIMTVKADLYPDNSEKVLALRHAWCVGHPEELAALVDVLSAAMSWCADPENHSELAYLLSLPHYLGVDHDVILQALKCMPLLSQGTPPEFIDQYISFDADGLAFPDQKHALWLYAQMRRWGQVGPVLEDSVCEVFDPSTIERNIKYSGDKKFSSGNDSQLASFDGITFNSTDVEGYLKQFAIGNLV